MASFDTAAVGDRLAVLRSLLQILQGIDWAKVEAGFGELVKAGQLVVGLFPASFDVRGGLLVCDEDSIRAYGPDLQAQGIDLGFLLKLLPLILQFLQAAKDIDAPRPRAGWPADDASDTPGPAIEASGAGGFTGPSPTTDRGFAKAEPAGTETG